MDAPPRGARLTTKGASFALHAARAHAVELCLFERDAEVRVPMSPSDDGTWSVHVDGVTAGRRYGFRVHGPYDPSSGDRFNPAKLVIDPYARAFSGKLDPRGPVFGGDGTLDPRDSGPFVPKSVVVDERFDWDGDAPPRVPWADTVIYEAHVKGFTRRHPDVIESRRGTYAGLASEAAIGHLVELGVTTVELLPIHEALDEIPIGLRGMTNYWGYNTLGFFAPDQRFAADRENPVHELKTMVRALHRQKIEVVLDVVFNHTCEGDERGPTVSLRGIDNRAYYRLEADSKARYVNWTGCGNTVDVSRPEGIRLVLDSLRYWAEAMHVDGFRFDLAPALGRARSGDYDPEGPFFAALMQDPVLSRVKLIAEPWDVGPGGYQLGRFPAPMREWNASYRDGVRRFWNGHTRSLADIGYRLSGSSDAFTPRRGPLASVNFVTAHDGFTLRDLVTYEKKHNEANGEENKDGWSDNNSLNFGVEGETEDPAILAARTKQVRNFLATLLLTPGVPMLVAGDEMGRTQRGNNNAYVLDDETSWMDWELDGDSRDLRAFVVALLELRASRPELRRARFFTGEEMKTGRISRPPSVPPGGGSAPPRPRRRDIVWLRPDGAEMVASDWAEPPPPSDPALEDSAANDGAPKSTRSKSRSAIPAPKGAVSGASDKSAAKHVETKAPKAPPAPPPLVLGAWLGGAREHLFLLNGGAAPVAFRLPRADSGWHVLVDTRAPKIPYGGTLRGGGIYEIAARSLVLLESPEIV